MVILKRTQKYKKVSYLFYDAKNWNNLSQLYINYDNKTYIMEFLTSFKPTKKNIRKRELWNSGLFNSIKGKEL